ncbi:MAG TPA: biotin/lipoate A/B protein ligase family protein [Candidatus Edwardsbacteria bacterium]|nr:biotin/lipoate A/B protein ligase family protein [Candidatus Edwardsbacteria bacterium]
MSGPGTLRLVVDPGCADGYYNMALDEVLAGSVRQGGAATVRFYGWNPPAISLGYNQRADEIDLAACAAAGIDVVRRPTGGRAVFHRDEFTYSVAAPGDHPLLGGAVLATYRTIAAALIAGLRGLGIEAEMVRSEAGAPAAQRMASCFAAAGRYEVTAGGRKIVGSAQRRIDGVLLQQGSLLLAQPQDVPALGLQDSGAAVTAAQLLGRPVGFDEAVRAMAAGFAQAWGVTLRREAASGQEQAAAQALARGRRPGPGA